MFLKHFLHHTFLNFLFFNKINYIYILYILHIFSQNCYLELYNIYIISYIILFNYTIILYNLIPIYNIPSKNPLHPHRFQSFIKLLKTSFKSYLNKFLI